MILTPYGYDINTNEPLPDLMTAAEFDTATAKRYTRDARIATALRAASANIRDFCGWHLFPQLPCQYSTTMYDRRVSRVWDELLIQLPAKMVTEVTGITIDGLPADFYTVERNGMLHIYQLPCTPVRRHIPIIIDYVAGLDDQSAAAIKDIAASRAIRGLSNTAGVQSEAAGGVSVTYNADWAKGGGAGALSPIDAQTLNVWKLQGVF